MIWSGVGLGMIFMSVEFLLDTNILVYAYDTAGGLKRQQALDALGSYAHTRQAAISSQILGEFVLVVSGKLQHPLKGGAIDTHGG